MNNSCFVEVFSDCICLEILQEEIVLLPETATKIKEVQCEVLVLEVDQAKTQFVLSGEIGVDIYYVADDQVKMHKGLLPFYKLINVSEVTDKSRLKICADVNVAKWSLCDNNQLEIELIIKLKGFLVHLVSCDSLCNHKSPICYCEKKFSSSVELDQLSTQQPHFSRMYDVSKSGMATFFVHNKGVYPVRCINEISPDGVKWVRDGAQLEIPPGESNTLSLITFLRYYRIRYWSEFPSVIDVWFQSQS